MRGPGITSSPMASDVAMAPAVAIAPGPPGHRVFGSALELKRDLLGTYERLRREHGDVVRIGIGPPRWRTEYYVVFHPDHVRRVLATEADAYRKDNVFYDELRASLGDGLLNSQDERWLRQRRFVQPLFTRRRIAGYADTMAGEAAGLIERWREPAAHGTAVDLHTEMSRITLRIVGRLLFGADVERAAPVVARTFPVLGGHALARTIAPVKAPRHWPTPANRRADAARRAIHGACDELIAARRAGSGDGQDLMSLLLAARDGEEALDDAEVREQVLIFLLAGHDTTAIALTFALQLLGRHPDAQRRVRDEVATVLGDRAPTAEDYDRLSYTTMVLKEAMRLFPPAWGTARRTATGDRVGGFDIPPEADVAVSAWVTHRHPDFWEDPERFDPERFTPEREAARHRHAYFPFGTGPRACIGQYFSMLEAVIVLAMVVRRYELEALKPRIRLTPRITLHPAEPVPCRLSPR